MKKPRFLGFRLYLIGLLFALLVFPGNSAAQTEETARRGTPDSSTAESSSVAFSGKTSADELEGEDTAQSIQPTNFIIGAGTVIVIIIVIMAALRRRARKMDLEAWLYVVTGEKAGTRLPVEKAKLTIGSHPENDIVLTDDRISRHHCRLVYESGVFQLTDLNSLHGTFVGGERIEQVEIGNADEINLGGAVDVRLEIES